jgi:predicted alpha/beta-hydrolase family hydrolase
MIRQTGRVLEIETPHGPARVDVDRPQRSPVATLVLGHGAGGGVEAPDLLAARTVALDAGLAVARVTQPYRVAGRRSPAPAAQLDAAWLAVVRSLDIAGPLIVGGRSSGARVACRTATAAGAVGVITLAFPVHPPGRPDRSRLPELETGLPTLSVSGERDPFGVPPQATGREVVILPGAVHDLRKGLPVLRAAMADWLTRQGFAGA